MADHVVQRGRGLLAAGSSVGVGSQCRHTAGIDDALDAGVAGCLQQRARAVDIRAIQRGVRDPEPVVGRDVKQAPAARDRLVERRWVREITDDGRDAESLEIVSVALGAHEDANINAGREQLPGDRRADEASRARDEDRHRAYPVLAASLLARSPSSAVRATVASVRIARR